MNKKSLDTYLPDFFDKDTDQRKKYIEEQSSVDYLFELGREINNREEMLEGQKVYYRILVSKRIVDIVRENSSLIHDYFDF